MNARSITSLALAGSMAGAAGSATAVSNPCSDTPIQNVSSLTITEGATALGLTTLASVLPADIANLLDTSENITVFAPSNEAFANIEPHALNFIVNSPGLLADVLTYHVVGVPVDPRQTLLVQPWQTLGGQSVFTHRDGDQYMVNGSNVNCQGYQTKNGLVWVIDSVMLPQF